MGGRARAARGRRAQGAVRRAARARPGGGRVARRRAARGVRADARGRPPHDGDAPLRRAADRRHGAPRRLRSPRCAPARARRSPARSRSSLNALAGKGVHVVTVNDYLARRDADWMRPIYEGLGLTVGVLQNNQPYEEKRAAYACRHHVRHELRVRVRLPARQHGHDAGGEGPARRPHHRGRQAARDAQLRDRRRGRQHPHRRGAHAADHLRRARAGRRPLRALRQARAEAHAGQEARGHGPAREEGLRRRTTTTSSTRSTRPSRSPSRASTKAERFLGIDHLYRAENGPLVNHLHQALKAESLYKKDVDYAVIDGEVKIIDEFTGRILDGRRWSEGLHQAVEAKEGVRVREENQTLATITLQNYFRMYDKLAGMSGTALTEATEFMKIYKVGVVEIPTNKPMVRKDQNDQIYKTREGKWRAVAREIQERHDKGQPVLVGTISVEVSELLSARLRKMGVPHTVLNAKPELAEREGAIDRRGRAPRRGHDRDQHGRPRRGHQARRQPRAPDRGRADQARPQARRPGLRGALRRHPPEDRGAGRGRAARSSRRPAACSSAAPSATSRAGSTTSCAAAPAARVTRASRASSSPPRTTSCACSPATGSTGSWTASARSPTRARRSRSRRRCSRSRSRTRSARSRSRTTSSASASSSTTTS